MESNSSERNSSSFWRQNPLSLYKVICLDFEYPPTLAKNQSVQEELLCVLIGSWGRLGLAKYCTDIFGQISFLGLNPSTRLYNALIDALVKSNSLDLAYLKFQQMTADNCYPDRFTYNITYSWSLQDGVLWMRLFA
ncbi:hypothetical protein L6164_026568 [Bauhinia variegata]|uniref:Uncharacterized protein n=1 Tax=Bauhinia variegata TaxID=167791 RepID=A0ACB9LQK4_BAUVA|nr:hypothetical protein L6164_026568 [Bauhinia variegata]